MTLEGLLKMIEKMDSPMVTIYPGRAGTQGKACFCTFDCVDDSEKLTAKEAADLVADFMGEMDPGAYTARMKKGLKHGANEREIRFMNPESAEVVQSATRPALSGPWAAVGGDPEAYISAQLQAFKAQMIAEQEKEKKEAEIQALREELQQARGWEDKLRFAMEVIAERLFEKQGIPARELAAVARVSNPISGTGAPESDVRQDVQHDQEQAQEEDPNIQRITESVETIADKLGTATPDLLEKLAHIPPENLAKLAAMDQQRINMLTGML